MQQIAPTKEEMSDLSISSFKGIDVGLGKADPLATAAAKLAEKYPHHLVMMQAGKFLHAFDRSAHEGRCVAVRTEREGRYSRG